jgi:RecB family exonuclease
MGLFMRLILGPSGSGKTELVLEEFRAAVKAGKRGMLLAPTATLVQHIQNQLARDGLVFRPQMVQTLSAFVEPWARDAGPVSDTAFYLMVEAAARRVNRPEFSRVLPLPGFCASLAGAILEFASAGCSSARLASCLPGTPLSAAFLAVYQAVDQDLRERGLALRGQRFLTAAARMEAEGVGPIESIWLAGFHALPDPELAVLRALDRHTGVTLALNERIFTGTLRARLEAIGVVEERGGRPRTSPVIALVRAPGIERETEEIARRILEQAAAGRPFREIAVIVRPAESYVPVLRSTFERFGIPARFYFDEKLERHAAVRYLVGVVDALLSGWNHSATLAALRLAPRGALSDALDRFDFAVRERIPDAGLEGLRLLLRKPDGEPLSDGAAALLHELDAFAALEEWRGLSLSPGVWAARFRTLRNLFRRAQPTGATHDLTLLWRSQAAALNEFEYALDDAALALGSTRAAPFEVFWEAVKSALRLRPLRLADRRRDVVHVLSAHEARQWILPVVFVCGMVERQFPQFHRPDAFFPESARRELHRAGIRVRTAAEFEAEEQALFDAAVTRATLLVTLSYPEFDGRGERTFPSMFLEEVAPAPVEARAVRPQPRGGPAPEIRAEIHAPELLAVLGQKTATVNPSGLESYLQCPFQYFLGRTLRLKTAPKRPAERLDFLTQGIIVHDVLAKWWSARGDIAALFAEIYAQQCAGKRIERSFQNECLRHAIRVNLTAFSRDERWPRPGCTSETERDFTFPLAEGIGVTGKIDRIDISSDGLAFITDYKYSAQVESKAEDPNLLQAPLYLLAAERELGLKAAGMEYVGLKRSVEVVGWSAPLPEAFLTDAIAKTLRVVEEIRSGRIEAEPANPDRCRYCDFRDVCRIEVRRAAARVEHA